MKISIRDLFLVTIIVALVVGWWVDHRRQEAAKAAVESDGERKRESGKGVRLNKHQFSYGSRHLAGFRPKLPRKQQRA
jgi:hypothetical protein